MNNKATLGSMGSQFGQLRNWHRVTIVALLWGLQTIAPSILQAGSGCTRGPVMCSHNTAGTMRICHATLMCEANMTWSLSLSMSMNVTSCSPSGNLSSNGPSPTFTLFARAMVSAPTDRSCQWSFTPALRRLGGGTVKIDQFDGLPVELMDFSVAGSTTEAVEPNRANGK